MKTFLKVVSGLGVACVAALGAVPAGAAPATVVTNGSFEMGGYQSSTNSSGSPLGYEMIPSGSTDITGWTASTLDGSSSSDAVDWVNSYWTAEDGTMSIDLNGNAPGEISQTLTTSPGLTYNVTFWLSGNFDSLANMTRTATVDACAIACSPAQSYTFNWFPDWSHANMGWTEETYTFTATSNSTTLTFSGDPNTQAWGPVIDNVSAAPTVATSGAQCKDGGWRVLANPSTLMGFMNQGSCVSYFATQGDVPIGH